MQIQTQTYAPYTMKPYDLQEDLIEERDKELQRIKGDFVAVNQLMKELASHINVQGEMVDNIATNITHAKNDCKKAVVDLQKADAEDSSSVKLYAIIGAGIGTAATIGGAALAAIILL